MLQREQIKDLFKKSNATIDIHTQLMYEFIWQHFLKSPTLLSNNSLICKATGHRKPKGVNRSYFFVLKCLFSFCSSCQFMVSQRNDITQSNQRCHVHSELTSGEEICGLEETLTPKPRQDPELPRIHRHFVHSPQCAPFPDAKSALWERWQLLQEMGSRPLSWNSGIFVGSTGAQDPPSPEHSATPP